MNDIIKTKNDFGELIENFHKVFSTSYPMLTDNLVSFDKVKVGSETRNIARMDGAGGLVHLSIYPSDGEMRVDCWEGKLAPIEGESLQSLQVFFKQMEDYHQKEYVDKLRVRLMSDTLTPEDRNAMWLCSFEHGLCFGILCETHPTYKVMPKPKKRYNVKLEYKNIATTVIEAENKEEALSRAKQQYHSYRQKYPYEMSVSEYLISTMAEE